MYDCPECGAGLRYDIEKAALFCDHCGHLQDPYTYEKERDAEESDSFGVNVFVCPQCGGSGQFYNPILYFDGMFWQGGYTACPTCGGSGWLY